MCMGSGACKIGLLSKRTHEEPIAAIHPRSVNGDEWLFRKSIRHLRDVEPSGPASRFRNQHFLDRFGIRT
jgi:hypothetical protein